MNVPDGLVDQILDTVRNVEGRYPYDSPLVRQRFLRDDLQGLLEGAFGEAESDAVSDLESQLQCLEERSWDQPL